MSELFYTLSCALTGEQRLDRTLAESHQKRWRALVEADADKLLECWSGLQHSHQREQEIETRIMKDATLGPTAQKLILLWYTGGIKNAQGQWALSSSADHAGALAWKVIGSHPPGYSDQFYGHWKYPVEG